MSELFGSQSRMCLMLFCSALDYLCNKNNDRKVQLLMIADDLDCHSAFAWSFLL